MIYPWFVEGDWSFGVSEIWRNVADVWECVEGTYL